jgi:antitoxin (DNA-binding transcriptional repressor) of toxin-antitoxin stability system
MLGLDCAIGAAASDELAVSIVVLLATFRPIWYGSRTAELIHQLAPGDEIIICENERPVAKLIKLPNPARTPRPGPGLCKGMITIISDDDDHLEDFKDYMP